MDNKQITSLEAANLLIAAHDGNMALLYIWIKARKGDLKSAAIELNITDSEAQIAYEKLARIGLAPITAPIPAKNLKKPDTPLRDDTLPVYTAEEISRREAEDTTFRSIVAEASVCMGKILSSNEIMKLYGIYDYLALPYEVIVMMLQFVKQDIEKRYSLGHRPFMRAIETESKIWAQKGIQTVSDAEEFIQYRLSRYDLAEKIKAKVGMRGKKVSATQEKYINQWIELGFDETAVEEAYDRTVTNKGDFIWAYANSIMMNWHNQGCHNMSEIITIDPPKGIAGPNTNRSSNQSSKSGSQSEADLEKMLKDLENM